VAPIAAEYRERRAALIAFVGALPAEAWSAPSPDAGWDCKDLLAHIAGDTGKNLHAGLRLIVAGEPLPDALFRDFDERNVRDVAERRERSIGELIAEIEADGEETQRLLALLPENIGDRHVAGLRGTLTEALGALAEHDAVHLAQLREATTAGAIR
jgi:hypothetical protein